VFEALRTNTSIHTVFIFLGVLSDAEALVLASCIQDDRHKISSVIVCFESDAPGLRFFQLFLDSMSSSIINSNVRSIELQYRNAVYTYDDRTAESIEMFLSNCPSLRTLQVPYCSEDTFATVGRGIRRLSRLEVLKLLISSSIEAGSSLCMLLSENLFKQITIEYLDGEPVGSFLPLLGDALQHATRCRHLNLPLLEHGSAETISFLDNCLSRFSHLFALGLSGCGTHTELSVVEALSTVVVNHLPMLKFFIFLNAYRNDHLVLSPSMLLALTPALANLRHFEGYLYESAEARNNNENQYCDATSVLRHAFSGTSIEELKIHQQWLPAEYQSFGKALPSMSRLARFELEMPISDEDTRSILEGIKDSESITTFHYDKTLVAASTQAEIAFYLEVNTLKCKQIVRTLPDSTWPLLLSNLNRRRRPDLVYFLLQKKSEIVDVGRIAAVATH
jgi:hypothetical protein